MKPFNHLNAKSLDEAIAALQKGEASVIAGGIDLLGTLKDNITPEYPRTVVNIKTIPGLEYIKEEDGMLKIGATTRLADIALSDLVKKDAPALAEAADATASPAIREMAADMGLELIDLQDLFTDSTYCRDGIHPQKTGARMLADAIYAGVDW